MDFACEMCGCTETQYAMFSGGREYYCPRCDDNHAYPDTATLPPRIQMLRDGKYEELKDEIRRMKNEH